MRKFAIVLGTGVALALALGACGTDDDVTPAAETTPIGEISSPIAPWVADFESQMEQVNEDLAELVTELSAWLEG